jgi:hypothetical protein
MAGKKFTNAKAEAGRSKKADNASVKQAAEDRQLAQQEEASWQQGANSKKAAREVAASSKADEAARKRREKEELLAAEDAALDGVVVKIKKAPTAKKKAGKKSDLSLLEDALVSAADKKTKKKKEDVLAKQKAAALLQTKKKAAAAAQPLDPLLANTEEMLGAALAEEGDAVVGRHANQARMEAEASGIDAALSSLKGSGGGGGTPTLAKSSKALYNEFEARTLPAVKDDYPGLRLTQYKEKVWNLWRKSAENPANQVPPSS